MLDELERLLNAATREPWTQDDWEILEGNSRPPVAECDTGELAALVVALRNAAPAFIDLARAVETWRDDPSDDGAFDALNDTLAALELALDKKEGTADA